MSSSPNLIRMRELLEQVRGPTASDKPLDALVMIAIKIFEALPDALIIVDTSGKIVLANAQSEWLLGYTRNSILGKQVEEFIPERFRAAHEQYRIDYLDHLRTREMGVGRDLFVKHKEGREIPVEIMLSPIVTDDGTFILTLIRRKKIIT